jgi:formate dehydrogenase assembly factor FdhD
MTERELLKQALEALERACTTCFHENAHHQVMSNQDHFMNQVMVAIRAALAEPKQRCEYIRSSGTTHWCALAEAEPKEKKCVTSPRSPR